MRGIIRVERKRILSRRVLITIAVFILVFSIFTTVKNVEDYNIYHSTGMISIKSRENLKESKKHKTILNEGNLNDIIRGKDKSKYLYNINLLRIVMLNYPDKKIDEISNDDIKNFYNIRNENIKLGLEGGVLDYSKEQLNYLVEKGKSLKIPLEIGYAEGWKNFNSALEKLFPLVLVIVSIIVIGVFAEDSKTKMKELYTTTKNGKKTLINARLMAGFEVGIIIYSISITIFFISNFFAFGIEGYNLPIQSSRNYFFSVINISFLQQTLINLGIAFLAMIVLIALIYCFTISVKQILPSAVLVGFTWILMFILPSRQDMIVGRYITNFLPYFMCNFLTYYKTNELYTVVGIIMPKIFLVPIVAIGSFIIFIGFSVVFSRKKLNKAIK